jgi:hypothetical protein
MKKGNHYGRPLDVSVKDGQLVIAIGVQTLAHAVTYSDWANPFDEDAHDYIRTFAISDEQEFAKDVLVRRGSPGHPPMSDPIPAANGFHEHLDRCSQCEREPFNLCSEGARLLNELHREAVPFNKRLLAKMAGWQK